ncbi:gamma-glutamyl-gamma-aminobutyrate hydrolase family protein [Humidesulfovibrio idahonensis]
MRPVLVSQRVDAHPDRGERRDALDQRLCGFLAACGLLAVPVPNIAENAAALWDAVRPCGVLLSGGNDLLALGGDTPERERTETALAELAGRHDAPVFGICRGLQFLAWLDGAVLNAVPGHVASRHRVAGGKAQPGREVNSFHQWGVITLGKQWEPLALAPDGSVEQARRQDGLRAGIMWHPEREPAFAPEDIALVRSFF